MFRNTLHVDATHFAYLDKKKRDFFKAKHEVFLHYVILDN